MRPKVAGSMLRMEGPGPTTATMRGLLGSRVTESHMRVRGRMGWKMPSARMSTRLLIAVGESERVSREWMLSLKWMSLRVLYS